MSTSDPSIPPRLVENPPPVRDFLRSSATFSVCIPLVVILIGALEILARRVYGHSGIIRISFGFVVLWQFALMLSGLTLGIIVLAASRQHERKQLLVRALAGILMNGALLL